MRFNSALTNGQIRAIVGWDWIVRNSLNDLNQIFTNVDYFSTIARSLYQGQELPLLRWGRPSPSDYSVWSGDDISGLADKVLVIHGWGQTNFSGGYLNAYLIYHNDFSDESGKVPVTLFTGGAYSNLKQLWSWFPSNWDWSSNTDLFAYHGLFKEEPCALVSYITNDV